MANTSASLLSAEPESNFFNKISEIFSCNLTCHMKDDIPVCLAKSDDVHLCVLGVQQVGGTPQGRLGGLVEGYEVGSVQGCVTNTVLLL